MARMPEAMLRPEALLNAAQVGKLDGVQARQPATCDPQIVALALLILMCRIAKL